jgi:hypothetical protein
MPGARQFNMRNTLYFQMMNEFTNPVPIEIHFSKSFIYEISQS